MLLEQAYEGAPALLTGRYLRTVNEFTDQIPALLALGPLTDTDKLLAE